MEAVTDGWQQFPIDKCTQTFNARWAFAECFRWAKVFVLMVTARALLVATVTRRLFVNGQLGDVNYPCYICYYARHESPESMVSLLESVNSSFVR